MENKNFTSASEEAIGSIEAFEAAKPVFNGALFTVKAEDSLKYFQPEITDIRIGYECEIHTMTTGGLMMMDMSEGTSEMLKEPSIKCWAPAKCGLDVWYDKAPKQLIEFLEEDRVRTPYLTKEQIEAEGWTILDTSNQWGGKPSYRETFKKGNYFVVLDTRKPHIEIIAADVTLIDFLPEFPENFRVIIPCPSINEFRTICKLLNITK